MRLTNKYSKVSVQPLGAMLHSCVFRLKNGREVRPLYDAPWREDSGPDFNALPPIIQGLGSEWPCVPFGRPAGNLPLPPEWVGSGAEAWDNWAHGYSSNSDWQLERLTEGALRATIDYPTNTPIQRLEREVCLLEGSSGLALSLTVYARRETTFPLGLHPILSMEGTDPEALQLIINEDARTWSFPVDVEPGRNHFVPNQQNRPIGAVATCAGGLADIRAMPPEGQTEDLLFLSGTDGVVGLVNRARGCITTIKWDSGQLPGCLLWISNGGRDYYPWNGRVAALGIEPVASAFDLGVTYSLSAETPLSQKGIATAVTVSPGRPLEFKYSITVAPDRN